MQRSWVEISKDALRRNVQALRSLIGSEGVFCAVVKANAYGHGIGEVVYALARGHAFHRRGWFGVDSLVEALIIAPIIRDANCAARTLIMGYIPVHDARWVVRSRAAVTVATPETVRALAAASRSLRRTVAVHVKVETGTQRQGVTARELPAFVRLIERSRGLVLEGISTHLADVEDTGPDGFARLQLGRFNRAVATGERMVGRRLLRHASASAAAMLLPDARFDLVRVGIALYGLWPSQRVCDVMRSASPPAPPQNEGESTHLVLRPVLTWKTIVGPMHEVPKGAPVGYGCTERVRRRTRIAVLPVGYWDGYDRKLSSVGEVLIRGRRCKAVGRVCMNMMMVDVTNVPRVRLEDEVVLIGCQGREEITANEFATKIGTINYEVVTRINPTIPRMLV